MGDNNLPKLNKKLAEEFANRVSRKQYIKETPIMLPGQVKSFTGGIDYGRVKKELGPGTNIFHKGLQRRLGEEQSAWNKWGNFAMQVGAEIIGGTIEGIGYLGDVKGTVDMLNGDMDSFGNWVADIGVAMKEGSREHFPIFGAHDMGNLGFWLSNGVSVSSSLSLMIPAVGAVRGVSALGKAIGLAGKVGKNTVLGQILKLPLGQAVASRHMENFMEARQTWDTTRQIMFDSRKKDGSRYSLEEADYAAAEAASTLYKVNYTLLAQDVFQYALLGRGPKASMEITNRRLAKAAGQGLSETMRRTAFPYLKDAISEGAEEAAQFVFSEESRYRALLNAGAIEEKDVSERLKGYVQDREFWTNAMFGAIGSGVMQSVGAGLRRSNIPIFGGKKQQEFLEERIAHAKEAYSSMSEAAMDLNAAILNKDEAGIKAAENKIKFNIAYNAAALGNLDISTATVDAFVEAVEGSTEKDSYAPDLTKRMEGLKADMKTVGKLYEKNAKKYAASSVRDITQLQFDNLKSAEELKEVEKKISAAKRAYPRYNNLSSQGQELFDLMVEREALNESLVGSMVAQAIKLDKAETQEEQQTIENQTKSFIEGINSQIKQVESRIKEIEKEQSDAISNENKGALVDNARNIAKRDIKILDGFVENSEEVVKERVKEVALNTTIDRNNEVLKLLTNKKVQDLTEEQEQKAREAAQKAAKEALEKDKKDKKKKREESVDNSKDEKIKKEEEEKKKKKEEAKKKKEEKPSTSLEDRIKALPTEELEELQRKAFAVNDVEGAKKMQDELDRRKKGESKEEEKIDEKVVEKSDLAETHDDEQPPMANNPVEFDEISGLPFDPVSDTGYSLAWLSTTMLDGVALAGQEDPELAQLITEYLENPEINLVGTHTVRFKIDQERINSYKELRPGTELDFYNAWKKYKKDGKINDAMLGQLPIVVELIGPDGKVVTLEDSNGNDRQLIIPIHDATFKNWEKLATVDLGDGYTKKDQAIDELLRIKRNILDNQDSENVAEVTEQRGGVPYNVEEYTAFLDALNLSSEDAVILSGSKAVNEEGKGEYLQHDKSTFNPFLAQGIGASATPGAFYAVVKRPNGEFFPVRLWTSKIGEAEATLIYNIYRKIASARKAEESLYDVAVSDKRLSDILNEIENSDDAKVSGLKDLIDADPNMTLSDLLSLLVYEGAVTKDAGKHRLLLGKKELKIGNKSFPIKSLTAETEDVHTHKDKIINELQKRLRQVSLKRVNDPIYKTYLSQAEIFTANFEPGENNFVQGTVVFGEISNTKPSKRPSKKKKPVTKPTTDTTTENIGKQITISNNRTVKIEETIPIYTGKDGYIIEVLHEGSKYVLAIYPDGDITDAAVIKEGLTENIKSNHPAIQFTKEDIAAIFSDAKTTTDTTTTTTKKGTINVYWGQAESSTSTKVLSNLAPRKFIWEGREYGSVEHAYQSNKSGTFDEDTYNKYLEGGSNNIKINKGKWTKDSPKENPDTAYIFTENINSIGSTRIGGGSAVIRNNPNAIGIVTKKYYTYKENRTSKNKDQWNQNFQDTDADFEIFKKVNLEQFDKIDNFDSIIFPDSFANSLASIPNRFALWLQNELQNRYGLITELNSKGTGLISKSISSTRNVKNAYGKKIRGKGTVAQMKAADSLGLMKQLVVESFKQNPNSEAAKKLMQYENFTHNTNQLIDQAFLEGLKLAQQELEKTTTTDTTTINPNIDLQLFEKIKALLVAKYPEIALTISAKPKWERANKNSIFNQNLDQILSDKYNKWDENNAAVSLTKEMQEANKNYAIVLDKNKMSINTTVNLLITKNPLEYVSVYPNGSVWLDTTKLANDVLKELGDTIIPQETKDEIKEFQDDLNNPEQYEERWIEYKNDLDSKIARIENTLEETKIENLEKKTASELFEIFVKTQTTEKGKSDIYRSFDLRQLDGKNIFHYNFKDGKLLDIYVRVPTKGGYTHEKVDPNDLGIDAQLALKEFKKDKNRITRAIDVMIAERLKDQLKYLKDGGEFAKSDYYQGKTEKERFIEEMIDFRREAIQFDESDIIELGLTTLIENNLIGNNIAIKGSGNGVRLAKPFGFKTNNLLELTRADEYKKIIDKKAKLNNILANKENFNNEYDQFELEDGDTLAPIPGWFLNAYSVEQTGKYFDEHTGIASGMIKGVLSMGAQQEYDNLYDYGVTPAFEILANTSDINSLLVDKIDYAKSTNLSNNFAILNQKDKNKIIGQANVKALTVLIDAVNQKQDTLPHEYAHHYINMWRDSPIVQEGIKRFGSEEALVEAIGKQAVEFVRTGKVGEALKWYQKFVKWILDKFTDQDVLDILTDAFLTRTELNKLEASKLATDVADTIEETPTLEIGRYVQDGEGNTYIIVAQTTGGKWKVYDPTSNTTKTSLPKDLTPSKFKGTIVPYQNSKYIVTAKGDIISLHTKRKLKYPATHPTAKAIRKKADEIRAEEKGIELIDVPVSKTVEEQVAEVKANIKKFKTKGKDGVIREIGEDDDFESYVLVDSKGNILHELARVSTFVTPEGVDKTKPLVSESLVIGTKADSLIRDFFEGELKEFGEYELTTGEEFDNFIQQLQGLKERFEKDGETVLASGILAYNTEMGAAGTLDLLTYDVDGNFRIYDIKTQRAKDGKGKNERINRYTGKTDYDSEFIDKDTKEVSKSDRQKHQEQLSMYKMMLEKTHGIKIEKIEIIPVLVDYNVGDSGTETLKLLENIPHEPLNKLFGFSTSSTNNAGKRASTQKGGKNVTKSSSKETQESKEAEFAARNLDKNTLESKSKLTDDQKKKNLKDLLGKKGGISKPASKKKRGGLSNKHGNEFTGSVDKIIDLEDSRSPITQAEINKVLSILPEDVKFEMVEDYINLLSGGRASVGLFKSGLITLSVKAKSGDAYHEAFHAVFRSALSDKQRTELLEEAKEVFLAPLESDIKFLQDRHNLSREEAIDLYYEEQLADEFGIYSQDPSNYTNKEGKTKNRGFFKRLLEWIKNIIYKPNNYKTLFGNILDGNFSGGRNVDVFIQNNTINSIDNITKKPCY
jgi:hypothetical protein